MKKVLCMLLCLCMMISILPTAFVINAEAASNEMTFSYAYDVLRSPAFPEKIGAKVTIAGFKSPLKFGSSNIVGVEHYKNSKGKWKLSEVGTYGDISGISPAPTSNLEPVVKTIANNYGISDMNSLVIHKLTDEAGTHVGYGVVIGIDEKNGYALFVADLYNQSGAGYFLSKSEIKDYSVIFVADKIAGSKTTSSADSSEDPEPVASIYFKMDEPKAYGYASKKITVEQSDQMEVVGVKWNGMMWNPDGTLMSGATYTVDITLRIKSGVNMYFDEYGYDIKVNGYSVDENIKVSGDSKQAVVTCRFGPLYSEEELALYEKEEQERLEERENNRKGTPVDKLEPGDSGSFKFTGSVYFLDYPKDYTDPKIGSSTAIAGYYDEIEVVEAYIPSLNRENQFYHAVRAADGGEVKYVLVKEDKFSSYRKTGSNPDRPYAKKWASQIKIGDPIEKVQTHLLDFSDGKPRYTYTDSKDEKFYTEKVVYEHPDGVKPFTYTTAVVTYKAKDGYYFDEKLTKLNEYRIQAEHTTGFKIIDDKTMEVYLTAFTWDMGYDISITDEMRAFDEKVKNMHLIPMASASDLYFPLFNHWDLKLQARDFEFNEVHVTNFQEKNMRRIYNLPTTRAAATEYPRHFTLTTIEIADDDLSDDIPGLVGEWCLLTDGRYIPRSCLKDFKYETMFEGAPAKFVTSPFEFAGGSGTLEDPFLIETAHQLNAVRQGPKYHYKLIADIDLSTWGNWVPIGGTPAYGFLGGGKAADYAHTFCGSLDGNGHVISGMQIIINEETPYMGSMTDDWRAYGLFASLASSPKEYKIKNLGMVNFNIDVNYTNIKKGMYIYAGAIVGGMNNGTDIYNCYSVGGKININITPDAVAENSEITGANPDGPPRVALYVGGLFAEAGSAPDHRLHIEKCFNDSNITVNINGSHHYIYAGGIGGSIDTTHIHECYNSGNITLPVGIEDLQGYWGDAVAAGICANATIPEIPGIYHTGTEASSFIQNCYNSGNITGRSAFGIFGYSASDIHLENCYNVGQTFGNDFDQSHGYSTIHPILSQSCGIIPFGTEYVRNCTANGNAVTGSLWKTSATLGRKVLVSVPEDNQPSSNYSFKPSIVGSFTDVLMDAWYADPVKWAVDKSITNGTSATTFSPDNTCTRAQILTFLWRAVGSPTMTGANPFYDVNTTDYYYNAALWASSKGMISGTAFGPNTPCTRAETVIYLWKNAGCPAADQVNQFLDITNINSELGKAVSWAFMNSITGGTAAHAFSPDMTCTRGQIVTFLYRALK